MHWTLQILNTRVWVGGWRLWQATDAKLKQNKRKQICIQMKLLLRRCQERFWRWGPTPVSTWTQCCARVWAENLLHALCTSSVHATPWTSSGGHTWKRLNKHRWWKENIFTIFTQCFHIYWFICGHCVKLWTTKDTQLIPYFSLRKSLSLSHTDTHKHTNTHKHNDPVSQTQIKTTSSIRLPT